MECKCGYPDLVINDACPLCGRITTRWENFYYFSIKENHWIECRTESHCLKMAERGFKVKKIVKGESMSQLKENRW